MRRFQREWRAASRFAFPLCPPDSTISPDGGRHDIIRFAPAAKRDATIRLERAEATGPAARHSLGVLMLSSAELAFLAARRIGYLASADRRAVPHVVPVCFAVADDALYVAIDEKPKSGRPLKRLRNIVDNPAVAVVVDRYDEDWTRLGWVMLRGRAEILGGGTEHDEAQAVLRLRYPQLRAMRIADRPVIALRIERTTSWGDLSLP
jgi:PPOX class probable F420-dependent enzyme